MSEFLFKKESLSPADEREEARFLRQLERELNEKQLMPKKARPKKAEATRAVKKVAST